MKLPWERTTWEDAIKANIALSFAVSILSIFACYALYTAASANDRERIIFAPAVVDKQMIVSFDSANADYVKSFGLYVATLIGNITVANAKFVADSVAQFISPSIYADVRKTILTAAESRLFKEAAGSSKFVSTGVIYEAETRKVFVLGTMDLLNSGMDNQSTSLVYEMEIKMNNYKPEITSLTSYAGNSAHTLKWIEENVQDKNAEVHK